MPKPTQSDVDAVSTIGQLNALIDGTNVECSDVTFCSGCTRCTRCTECTGSADCTGCDNVDNSKRCVSCKNLGNCHDCRDCRGQKGSKSNKLYRCVGCVDCDRCIGMTNAKGVSNLVCGVSVTNQRFNALWALIEAANA